MNEFNVYINGTCYTVTAKDKSQARQKAKGDFMERTGYLPPVGSNIHIEFAA